MSPRESREIDSLSPADSNTLGEQWNGGLSIAALDGVRGVAILSVTLYRFCKEISPEAGPLFATVRKFAPMGERGVDLFFVLSGFLITGVLLRTRCQAGYYRNFLARRSLRIFPLYFSALALFLFVVPGLQSLPGFANADQFRIPSQEQGYLWTYTSNLRMSWLNRWSFGPLDHFWSLSVEEHFYLLWPTLILLVAPRKLLGICLGWVVVVLGLRTWLATYPSMDIAVDVHSLLRSDALCLGGIVGALVHLNQPAEPRRRWVFGIAIVSLLATLGVAGTGQRFWTIPNTIVPVLFASVLLIVMGWRASHPLVKLLEIRGLRWLGKFSYGMYVFQLPLVTLFPAKFVQSIWGSSSLNPYWFYSSYVAGMLGLTCLIAWVSYHAIEKHFLKLKRFF